MHHSCCSFTKFNSRLVLETAFGFSTAKLYWRLSGRLDSYTCLGISSAYWTEEQMIFSIVIPIHNEEENIAPLLSEITQKISPRHNYEIICVGDYSFL